MPQALIDSLDEDLRYAIEIEGKWEMSDAENYEEVRDTIKDQLEHLRDNPYRDEEPLIYHLDVAAMYPNIILTNRYSPLSSAVAFSHVYGVLDVLSLPPLPLPKWGGGGRGLTNTKQ